MLLRNLQAEIRNFSGKLKYLKFKNYPPYIPRNITIELSKNTIKPQKCETGETF